MEECDYCSRLSESTKPYRMGNICNNCEKELIEENLLKIGDPAIFSNKWLNIWINKGFFSLEISFSLTWFKISLVFITIESNS